MDNPERNLFEFIRTYYYGEVSDEAVQADTDAIVSFMRERGWAFEPIPAEARSR